MNSSATTLAIELHVPYAGTEREFLRLAVEAAARKYREMHRERLDDPAAKDRTESTTATPSCRPLDR